MDEREVNPQCRLYLGNLSFSLTEEDIKDMFGTIGPVKDVYLPRIFKTRKHKGYGFLEMSNTEDTLKAIAAFHGQPDINDRIMVVRMADFKKSREQLEEKRNKYKDNNKKYGA